MSLACPRGESLPEVYKALPTLPEFSSNSRESLLEASAGLVMLTFQI